MPCYSAEGTRTVSGSVETVLSLTNGSPTRRIKLYEIRAGTKAGTWADFAINWLVRRHTGGGGTSTSLTPALLDPADAAAITAAGENHTVEPTTLTTLLNLSVAQRLPVVWQAIQPGRELIAAAAANSGLNMTSQVSGGAFAGSADVTFLFEE